MIVKILSTFLLIMWLITPLSHLYAKEIGVKNKSLIEKEQPIEIVSNRLDAYNEKKLVIFSGNAVATQGDKTIKADQLIVYYKKNPGDSDKVGSKSIERSGDLEKIDAKGHVTIIQNDRIVTGDEATFDHDAQRITMIGNAIMREGSNIIRGERIVVLFNEKRGIVESAVNKRVTATIYPTEKQGKKK